jgi:hypothetical protein
MLLGKRCVIYSREGGLRFVVAETDLGAEFVKTVTERHDRVPEQRFARNVARSLPKSGRHEIPQTSKESP